jgi:hypothetical protein
MPSRRPPRTARRHRRPYGLSRASVARQRDSFVGTGGQPRDDQVGSGVSVHRAVWSRRAANYAGMRPRAPTAGHLRRPRGRKPPSRRCRPSSGRAPRPRPTRSADVKAIWSTPVTTERARLNYSPREYYARTCASPPRPTAADNSRDGLHSISHAWGGYKRKYTTPDLRLHPGGEWLIDSGAQTGV